MTHLARALPPRVAALVAALGLACASDADGPRPAGTVDVAAADRAAPDGEPACHGARVALDGTCCPVGHFFSPATAQCEAVGPPACAETLLESPEACVPRWCWDWTDTTGAPCEPGSARCLPAGRECTAAELLAGGGCAPGAGPDLMAAHPGGPLDGCFTAGTGAVADPSEPLWEIPPVASPPGVPTPDPLPELAATRFCWDVAGAKPRLCAADEPGCGPGAMPDPDAPERCLAVGAPWICPPGFALDAAAARGDGQLPRCAPDPAACSAPLDATGDGVVHVDAAAEPGGDGTAERPYQALAAAPTPRRAAGSPSSAGPRRP